MVKFFRDVLNGPLYIIIVLISIILIMAIIGFLMEKKQKQDEVEKSTVRVGKKINENSQEIPSEGHEVAPQNVEVQQNINNEIN